jgi:fumarate reductase subunit C
MGGLKCHACRRFVLRRAHVVFLILIAVVVILGLLELVAHLTPPPLKTH